MGVDWGREGMELAQVALGFGATDLTGPITRKSGTLISEDELKKVKGQGMVAATALKRRELAALVHNAGRTCEFTSAPPSPSLRGPSWTLSSELDSVHSGSPEQAPREGAEIAETEEVVHA